VLRQRRRAALRSIILKFLAQISRAPRERLVFGVRELPREDCLKPSAMMLTPWRIARAAAREVAENWIQRSSSTELSDEVRLERHNGFPLVRKRIAAGVVVNSQAQQFAVRLARIP
jgi:hypothetical protein